MKGYGKKKAGRHVIPDRYKDIIARMEMVLIDYPMTVVEINEAMGTDYSALQIAGAAKYIDGIQTTEVNKVDYRNGE